MAEVKTHPVFLNFSGGEFAPQFDGREDLKAYFTGLKTLKNWLPLAMGGATRRWGSVFVAEIKDSARKALLLDFTFSTVQSYILEVGHLYIRFFKDTGRIESPPGTPVEIATPYTESDLVDLAFDLVSFQGADTLFLLHPNYEPRTLTRLSHTQWVLAVASFDVPATAVLDTDLGTTLTPDATSGTGVTFTSGAAVFLAGDVGRSIKATNGGLAKIVTFTDTTHVVADIVNTFPDVSPIASGSWFLTGSPQSTITPTVATPVGAASTLNAGIASFRAADVGKFVRVNSGQVKVTTFTNASSVTGTLQTVLSGTTAAGAGTWSMESVAWSTARGFPRTGTFHDQRAYFGGTLAEPQAFWGTKVGDFGNFAIGANAADGLKFTLATNRVNAILWLASGRNLFAGTVDSEFVIKGSGENAISPTSILVRADTTYGSAQVAPLLVGDAVFFFQRSGERLRELALSADTAVDSYKARDLTALAVHILAGGAVQAAYCREPIPSLWIVRNDGVIATLTYDREHDTVGWARQTTDGLYESVGVVYDPVTRADRVWCIAKRTINGQTKRYVEYFDQTKVTDCGLSYSGAPAAVFAGLSHLEGKTVDVVGDAAVYVQGVVTAAQITISPSASVAEIGLHYEPELVTLRPAASGPRGSIRGAFKRWHRLYASVYDSVGGTVNGVALDGRSTAGLVGVAVPRFTGDQKVPLHLGWDQEGRLTVKQTQPLPLTLLSLFGSIIVSDD